jgi:Leucine-rich repeat (LRR) protein
MRWGQFLWLALAVLAVPWSVCGAGDNRLDQMRALAEVKRLKGTTETDAKAPGQPVVKVNLANTKADDKTLALIAKAWPQLQTLELEGTNVTDTGLVHLEGLSRLKRLALINTVITDKGLAHLKGLTQLQVLDLSATKITDQGLAPLKGLANLRELSLGLTKITDAGLGELKGLTQLRKLDLFLSKVTAGGVRELQKDLPRAKIIR